MSIKKSTKKVHGVFEKVPGSGVWWIQHFDSEGRRRREKVGPRGRAIKLVESRRTDAQLGKKCPDNLRAKRVTFREIATSALEYSKTEKQRSYRSDVGRMTPLVEAFGDRQAEGILPEEFEKWLNVRAEQKGWRKREGELPTTRNRYIALIKLTFRLAERDGKIKINPARLLRMRKENNARVRYLNQHKPLPTQEEYLKDCHDEESRLRAVINTRYPYHLPEFEIALNTGMRRSEQYRIEWNDVDFARHVLTVRQSKHGESRYVPLNSVVLAVLEFLRSKGGDSSRVFVSERGDQPLTMNRHWFEDAVKMAGVRDFTWHDIRHTFASRLAMAGVDLRRLQVLMGHKTIQVTTRYAHLAPADLLAAVEKLVVSTSATTDATDTDSTIQSGSSIVH